MKRWDRGTVLRATVLVIACLVAALGQAASAASIDVTTYHYDAQRTGWNQDEKRLNWSDVGSSRFGLLKTVNLDEQVDAQALVVSAATLADKKITGYPNDLVYIATENNTVYAIDTVTGAVKFQTNLGTPVSKASLPGSCASNSTVVGITSTPVVDLPRGVMYVIAYSVENGAAVYRIHELSLATLTDVIASVVVSASQKLGDGTVTKFNAATERQRPALLLSKNIVYAGFGSFCDLDANLTRGWLLGWTAGSLQPLRNVGLMDRQTPAETGTYRGGNFYMSAIWMSGYGMAADFEGYIYLQTGNSDKKRIDNLQESAVKVAPGEMSVADYFTPANFDALDSPDLDLGSGRIMVVPDRLGAPRFAAGGGKDGRLFLYDRDDMGGFSGTGVDAAPSVTQGPCWCGPSYFVGSDGKARVVSSGGLNANTWFLPTTTKSPLVLETTSANLPASVQDGGFMTSVSSNGTIARTAIIWAQTRANASDEIYLYAFAASPGLPTLYSGISGVWTSLGNNANIVPVVANGKVFVPSKKQLRIFGLLSEDESAAEAPAATVAAEVSGPRYFGRIVSVDPSGETLTLRLRTGLNLEVDAAAAMADHKAVALFPEETVEVMGRQPLDGPFAAAAIVRSKSSDPAWGPDVP